MGEELFGIGGTIAGGIYGGNVGALIGGAAGGALGNRIFGEDEDDALRRARTSANISGGTDRFGVSTTSSDAGLGLSVRTFDTPASVAREARVAGARADLAAAAKSDPTSFLNNQFVDRLIADVEDQRLATSSNLRAVFDRRRIPAGTSFREALIAQSDKDFAKTKVAVRGAAREAALQNLFRSIDTVFSEANAEANRELQLLGISLSQSQSAASLAQSNAQFEREMARLQAVGTGQFLGLLGTQFGDKSESDSDTRPQAGNFSIFDGFGNSSGSLGVGGSRAISGSSSTGAGSSPFFSALIGAGS